MNELLDERSKFPLMLHGCLVGDCEFGDLDLRIVGIPNDVVVPG